MPSLAWRDSSERHGKLDFAKQSMNGSLESSPNSTWWLTIDSL